MNPYYHALSSVKKWGGEPADYLPIHSWFDESKSHYADQRHRALRHHSAGIFECELHFGHVITNSAGKQVPVRLIGERHVKEDCGFIPTVKDWLQHIQLQPWMRRVAVKSVDVEKMPDRLADPAAETNAAATVKEISDAQWAEHWPEMIQLLPEGCQDSADNLP